jgi:uncharacterized protein (TIGR02266 family)
MSTDKPQAASPSTQGGAERRTQPRIPLNVEVSLESESNFYSGLTQDISSGGVFVATYMPPPVGSEIQLTLALPGAPAPLALRGIVRWARDVKVASDDCPAGCGVQFLDLSADDAKLIERFLATRDSIFYDD